MFQLITHLREVLKKGKLIMVFCEHVSEEGEAFKLKSIFLISLRYHIMIFFVLKGAGEKVLCDTYLPN